MRAKTLLHAPTRGARPTTLASRPPSAAPAAPQRPRPGPRHRGGAWRGRRSLIGCGRQGAAPRLGRAAVWSESARGGEGAAGSCWKSGAGDAAGAPGRGRLGLRQEGPRLCGAVGGDRRWRRWRRRGRCEPGAAPGPSLALPAQRPDRGRPRGGRAAASPSSSSPGTARAGERRGRPERRGPAMATTSTTGSTLLQPLSNAVQLPIDQVPRGALAPGVAPSPPLLPAAVPPDRGPGRRVGAGAGRPLPPCPPLPGREGATSRLLSQSPLPRRCAPSPPAPQPRAWRGWAGHCCQRQPPGKVVVWACGCACRPCPPRQRRSDSVVGSRSSPRCAWTAV